MDEDRRLLVLTGATGGLGKVVALYFVSLAVSDRRLLPVFCCRNRAKAGGLCREVEAAGLEKGEYAFLFADLSSGGEVKRMAEEIKGMGGRVRFLVNNAASMFSSCRLNGEGVEMNMAVNFYAPALLSELLAPLMEEGGSVVNVLSVTRKWYSLPSGFRTGDPRTYSRLGAYSRSKLALSVFTADMAERYPALRVNGVDPGVMNTSMLSMDRWFDVLSDRLFRPFTREPEQSLPAVVHACENGDGVSGQVFTVGRHFPIEKKIVRHPLREEIRDSVLHALEP